MWNQPNISSTLHSPPTFGNRHAHIEKPLAVLSKHSDDWLLIERKRRSYEQVPTSVGMAMDAAAGVGGSPINLAGAGVLGSPQADYCDLIYADLRLA